MNLEHRTQEGVDIVKLPERLMMADAAGARATLKEIIDRGSERLGYLLDVGQLPGLAGVLKHQAEVALEKPMVLPVVADATRKVQILCHLLAPEGQDVDILRAIPVQVVGLYLADLVCIGRGDGSQQFPEPVGLTGDNSRLGNST